MKLNVIEEGRRYAEYANQNVTSEDERQEKLEEFQDNVKQSKIVIMHAMTGGFIFAIMFVAFGYLVEHSPSILEEYWLITDVWFFVSCFGFLTMALGAIMRGVELMIDVAARNHFEKLSNKLTKGGAE